MDINMSNLSDVVRGVNVTKRISVSSDIDSKKAKYSHIMDVTVVFDGVTLRDVILAAASPKIITYQGSARKHIDTLPKAVTVQFGVRAVAAPRLMTPQEFAALPKAEREAYLASLSAIADAGSDTGGHTSKR